MAVGRYFDFSRFSPTQTKGVIRRSSAIVFRSSRQKRRTTQNVHNKGVPGTGNVDPVILSSANRKIRGVIGVFVFVTRRSKITCTQAASPPPGESLRVGMSEGCKETKSLAPSSRRREKGCTRKSKRSKRQLSLRQPAHVLPPLFLGARLEPLLRGSPLDLLHGLSGLHGVLGKNLFSSQRSHVRHAQQNTQPRTTTMNAHLLGSLVDLHQVSVEQHVDREGLGVVRARNVCTHLLRNHTSRAGERTEQFTVAVASRTFVYLIFQRQLKHERGSRLFPAFPLLRLLRLLLLGLFAL